MYTFHDHEPTDGTPGLCGSPSVVNLYDVSLCLLCYGREMNLSDQEALEFLKDTCKIPLPNPES